MSAVDTGSISTPPASAAGEISRKDMRVIWLLLVAAFVAILNETTMGIAIPHLNADLGIPPELGQWLTSAFMLTMAVVIPTTGFILQRFTTRQVFIAAMVAFSLGTLVALVAPGFSVLLIGRVIQAAGTGIMMPLLMTTIMNVVPPQSRGRMMGRVGLVISLAPAIGPTLAGAVLETLNWRALFAIILPIAIVALAMGAKWMTNLGETRKAPLDVLSIPLAALGFGGIVFGLSQFGGEGGSGELTGIIALVGSIICVLTPNIWVLLVGRVFQGLGGGVASSVARAILVDVAHGKMLARAMSLIQAIVGFAPMLAPVLGAFIITHATWRVVFWALAAFTLLMAALAWFVVPESLPEDRRHPGGRQCGDRCAAAASARGLRQRQLTNDKFLRSYNQCRQIWIRVRTTRHPLSQSSRTTSMLLAQRPSRSGARLIPTSTRTPSGRTWAYRER